MLRPSKRKSSGCLVERSWDAPGGSALLGACEELMKAIGFEETAETQTLALPDTVSAKRIEAILQLILS